KGRSGMALGVAVIALVVAVVAAATAVVALQRASETQRGGSTAAPVDDTPAGSDQEEPGPPGPTSASPTADDRPLAPGEERPLNPEATFTLKYEKETLILRAACGRGLHIDLDEPRVGAPENVADVKFEASCSDGAPPELKLGSGVAGSPVDSAASLSAADCAQLLRTARLGQGIPIPLQPGVMVCVLTSAATARELGISQKLAVFEVKAVGGGGATTAEVTAWEVPR